MNHVRSSGPPTARQQMVVRRAWRQFVAALSMRAQGREVAERRAMIWAMTILSPAVDPFQTAPAGGRPRFSSVSPLDFGPEFTPVLGSVQRQANLVCLNVECAAGE